jgi:hypothetical protein
MSGCEADIRIVSTLRTSGATRWARKVLPLSLIDYYGVRLRLWTAATGGHIVHPPRDMSVESDGGMILTGENRRTRRKTSPGDTLSPKIPQGLTRGRNWASALRGRRLTAWAMARPLSLSLVATILVWANFPSPCWGSDALIETLTKTKYIIINDMTYNGHA